MFYSQAKVDPAALSSAAYDDQGFYRSAAQNDIYGSAATQEVEKIGVGIVDKRDLITKARLGEKEKREKAVAGVYDAAGIKINEVQASFTWRKMEVTATPGITAPRPRSGHVAFTLGAQDPRIFIHGGAADSVYFNDIYVFHTEKRQWMLAHTYSKPKERAYHTVTLAAPDMELPQKMQIPRLLMYGGFMKGALFEHLHIMEEWGPIVTGKNGYDEIIIPPKKMKDNPAANQIRDVWVDQAVTGEAPLPRCMHTATLVGGRHMVVIGGWHSQFVNDIYVLDTVTMNWEYKPAPLVVIKEPVLDADGNEIEETEEEKKAEEHKHKKIRARAGHTATLLPRRRIFVFGGQNKEGQIDEPLLLDLNKMEWTRPILEGRAPTKRSGHSACYDGVGKVIIYGGWDGQRQLDDLHVLNCASADPSKWYWMTVEVHGYKVGGMCGHTATFVRDRMFLFGGWANSVFHNSVYVLDVTTAFGKLKSTAKDIAAAAKGGKVAMAATVAALRKQKEEEEYEAAHAQEHYVENLKKMKSEALETQAVLEQEDLSEVQLAAINQKLEQELVSAHHLIEARRTLIEASEVQRDKVGARRMNQINTEVRRMQLKAALEQGMPMKEALQFVDSPEQLLERRQQAAEILQKEGVALPRDSTLLPPIEIPNKKEPVDAKPPPPVEEDMPIYKREAMMTQESAFNRMAAGDPSVQLQGDPLGIIEATGGLTSCYVDDKRQKILGAIEEREATKKREGALAMSMNYKEWEAKTTFADVINAGKAAGREVVPRRTARPPRHLKPKPDVGTLDDIQDGFVPVQPDMLEYNADGFLLPAPEGTGAEMKLVPYTEAHPEGNPNSVLALRNSQSVIRSFQELSAPEQREDYEVPEGIRRSINMMQSAIRGYTVRKHNAEAKAAMRIQAFYRGWQVRERKKQMKQKVKSVNQRLTTALKVGKTVLTRIADEEVKLPPGILPPL